MQTIIKPKTGLFDVDFKELIRYKDLWLMYVKRDIVTQYKQTILGPVWFFVNPALTTVIYMVIFGRIARISTDGIPQPLFYLAGICMWNYFSTCLTKTSSTFIDNQSVFGKVYFPRLIVPLSTVTSTLVTFGTQLILFIAVYIYFLCRGVAVSPNNHLLLLPALILMLAGLSLGFGIITSSMTTKYRDLNVLFTFIVQLWMYATPIIYPLSMMPSRMRKIMLLNPVSPIIETFKYATLGKGTFGWYGLCYSFIFMCVLLGVGVVVFNRVQRSFMDTV